MKLIPFKEQTVVIAEHQKEYLPMPAFKFADDASGRVSFLWKLTVWERVKLLFTGKLWHTVMTFHQPIQPQMLGGEKPFTREDVLLQIRRNVFEFEKEQFTKIMLAQYGETARKKNEHFDALNYHPNDRRRCVKVAPDDFKRAKEFGLMFIEGARIVDNEYKSAV